jgi:hypothetical protein
MRLLARKAPVALMSRVFVRSRKSAPVESTPRTNIGIWTRILGERRRSVEIRIVFCSSKDTEKLISLQVEFGTFVLVPRNCQQLYDHQTPELRLPIYLILFGLVARFRGEKIFHNFPPQLLPGFSFYVQNGTHLPLTRFCHFDSIPLVPRLANRNEFFGLLQFRALGIGVLGGHVETRSRS